ncbi:hypothetical protein N9J84_05315 [Porticoccaceae bacterium]|nr:hypothetical protein [Porticoccaceae bacterium]
MPVTKVKTPEGQLVKVSHPDNATPEQIIKYAQMSHESKPTSLRANNRIKMKREGMGGGELQIGPIKTGIKTSQAWDEALAGAGKRLTEIGTLGFHDADPDVDQMLDQSVSGMLGGAAADLAVGAGVGRVIPSTGLGQTKSFKRATAGGSAYGGATTPDRTEGLLGGGIGAGMGHGLTKAIAKIANPQVGAPAKAIINDGGTLTPGEILGGTTKRFEDAATSIPVLGDAIKGAQKGSLEDFNRSTINKALSSIGQSIDDSVPAGREAIAKADELVSKKYTEVLSGMDVQLDQQFADEIKSLVSLVDELPATQKNQFQRVISDYIAKPFDNENRLLLGNTFKESDSALRALYKKYQKSNDLATEKMGDALRTAHQSLLEMAKRQHPQLASELSKADQAYAAMYRVSEAANYAGAKEGVFTPSHLLNATKRNTSKKSFARGGGFNQKEIEAAKEMLSQTIPDSGTTTRALFNLGVLGGGGAVNPMIPAGLLGGAGLYTAPGKKVMQSMLAKRPPYMGPVRNTLESLAPVNSLLGLSAGSNLSQQ